MGHIPKTPVSVSLSPAIVEEAQRLGIDLSEVAETAIAVEIERRARNDLQARMDRLMEHWNEVGRKHLSIADEFGTL